MSKEEDQTEKQNPDLVTPKAIKSRLMVPIVFKLFVVCIVLILSAVVPISINSTNMFSDLSHSRARDANRDQVTTRAVALESELKNIVDKVKLLTSIIMENLRTQSKNKKQTKHVFSQLEGLVSLQVLAKKDDLIETKEHLVDTVYLKQFNLNK